MAAVVEARVERRAQARAEGGPSPANAGMPIANDAAAIAEDRIRKNMCDLSCRQRV
jgi:hypothetical protein